MSTTQTSRRGLCPSSLLLDPRFSDRPCVVVVRHQATGAISEDRPGIGSHTSTAIRQMAAKMFPDTVADRTLIPKSQY